MKYIGISSPKYLNLFVRLWFGNKFFEMLCIVFLVLNQQFCQQRLLTVNINEYLAHPVPLQGMGGQLPVAKLRKESLSVSQLGVSSSRSAVSAIGHERDSYAHPGRQCGREDNENSASRLREVMYTLWYICSLGGFCSTDDRRPASFNLSEFLIYISGMSSAKLQNSMGNTRSTS